MSKSTGRILPEDILHMIFCVLAQYRVSDGSHIAVASDVIPLVCKLWRAITHSHSVFWETVLIGERSTACGVRRKLALTGQRDLRVEVRTLELEPKFLDPVKPSYVDCVKALTEYSGRTKSIKIAGFGVEQTAVIAEAFSGNASLLEEVFVESIGKQWWDDSVMFNNIMPNVTHAIIVRAVVSLQGFDNLRTLRLLNQTQWMDYPDFMLRLSQLPQLECLELRMGKYDEWLGQDLFKGTIELDRLRELTVELCENNAVRLLSPIVFPDITRVDITIHSDNELFFGRFGAWCPHLRALTGSLRTAELAYEVHAGDHSVTLSWPEKPICISWTWNSEAAQDARARGQPGMYCDAMADLRNVTLLRITKLPDTIILHQREWRRILELLHRLEVLEVCVDAPRWQDQDLVEPDKDRWMACFIFAHFATLCEELARVEWVGDIRYWQGKVLLCPRLHTLASPYDWIRSDRTKRAYALCASTRLAAGMPTMSLCSATLSAVPRYDIIRKVYDFNDQFP